MRSTRAAARAHREPDADLVRTARHGVRQHTVEADGREQSGKRAEGAGQRRHQPLTHQSVADRLFDDAACDGDRWIDLGHSALDRRSSSPSTSSPRGFTTNRAKRGSRSICATGRWTSGSNSSRMSPVLRVARDADNLELLDRLPGSASIHSTRPIGSASFRNLSHERLVDDRHGRRRARRPPTRRAGPSGPERRAARKSSRRPS